MSTIWPIVKKEVTLPMGTRVPLLVDRSSLPCTVLRIHTPLLMAPVAIFSASLDLGWWTIFCYPGDMVAGDVMALTLAVPNCRVDGLKWPVVCAVLISWLTDLTVPKAQDFGYRIG
jgi:hypothetical protein